MARKRNRRGKKNYTLIFAVVVAVLVVGYATFAQPLAYRLATLLTDNSRFGPWVNKDSSNGNDSSKESTGDQSVSMASTREWDIGFDSVELESVSGKAREISKPIFNETSASFNVAFEHLGDEITYVFKIRNSGIINAKVESINIIPTPKPTDAVLFSASALNVGDAVNVGDTAKIKVSARYINDYGNTAPIRKATIIINYVQK